ncbi:AI-2E family transporter [Ornithinimicrobium faecis]|uniref:AI-2E family transporter n=1 Tax=Ornithinimicrobium faecis TaxID=2934158 RepID=A0ABY4YN44_9MICO|nr:MULTISPECIES: AI-2E family transporter [unclassified Ornithinimicrobium]USQ78174.1 AI-2E family transporter [Ornithinimicrobium sp. HY1793]
MNDDRSQGGDEDNARFGATPAEGNVGIDRGKIVGDAMAVTAKWSLRFIIVCAAAAVLLWLLSKLWVGIFPVMLALIVSTVLSGPVGWMRRKGVPAALAAAVTLVVSLLLVLGTLAAIAPSIIAQTGDVVDRASEGIVTVREWLAGPPVNLDNEQLDGAIKEATGWLQERASDIASGVFTGVSAVTSAFVTLALVLVLTFFFIKDGPTFLPWVRRNAGRTAGQHLTEMLTRVWVTLGGFIRTQAIVSAVDAFFIGLGLVILSVPLAPALAILTFMAGFIPIVGAFVAGALAVLVALVSNGWVTALWVLGIVLLVQQIEGNVLQPLLQSRTMKMHPVIILLSVAAGGTLFGIPGAFLAVPVAASVVVALRYVSEQIDLRTGDLDPSDLKLATPEGAMTTRQGVEAGRRTREELERAGTEEFVVGQDPDAPASAPSRSSGSPLLGRLHRRKRRR